MRKLLCGLLLMVVTVQCQYNKKSSGKEEIIHTVKAVKKTIQPVSATLDIFGVNASRFRVKNFQLQEDGSLYMLLSKLGMDPGQIYEVAQEAKKVIDVHALRPKQKFRAYLSKKDGQQLKKLVWQPDEVEFVVFDWLQDSLQVYKASRVLTQKVEQASGEITSSLYAALPDNATRDKLVYKIAEIFAWEIDFFNLRKGDYFKILFEKNYVDGQYYDVGDVRAIEFHHMGDTYFAYKFQHGEFDGYFDQHGNSVQKALLKNPFEYDYRISSSFGMRYHPILHEYMGHSGTDYTAPFGTPVHATGDGVVITAGYAGAAGNMVKIKHNGVYKTAYMHMSDFADGIHDGAHVEQGQVIGYVGSTGRSTGAHLHYSVYRNGTPINSLTLDLPSSKAIPDKYMGEFKKVRNRLNSKLYQQEILLSAK